MWAGLGATVTRHQQRTRGGRVGVHALPGGRLHCGVRSWCAWSAACSGPRPPRRASPLRRGSRVARARRRPVHALPGGRLHCGGVSAGGGGGGGFTRPRPPRRASPLRRVLHLGFHHGHLTSTPSPEGVSIAATGRPSSPPTVGRWSTPSPEGVSIAAPAAAPLRWRRSRVHALPGGRLHCGALDLQPVDETAPVSTPSPEGVSIAATRSGPVPPTVITGPRPPRRASPLRRVGVPCGGPEDG